ncbi:hypothetical protein BGW37DRAFT_466968 [Umbelopsis sp. PMI_123]|nr:hypothetical protein BGW37DRAFT_466968 [Umbelopsis sp. PMI_123]
MSLPSETVYQVLECVDINDVWSMSQVCQVYRRISFYNLSHCYRLDFAYSDSTLFGLRACLIRSIRRAANRSILEPKSAFIDLTPKLVHYVRYCRRGTNNDMQRADAVVRMFVEHILHTHHSYSLSWYLQRQLARLHEQYPIATLLQANLSTAMASSYCQNNHQAIKSIATFLITNATTCPEIPLSDSFIFNTFETMCNIALNTSSTPKDRKMLVDILGRVVFEMPIRGSVGRQMRQRLDQLHYTSPLDTILQN